MNSIAAGILEGRRTVPRPALTPSTPVFPRRSERAKKSRQRSRARRPWPGIRSRSSRESFSGRSKAFEHRHRRDADAPRRPWPASRGARGDIVGPRRSGRRARPGPAGVSCLRGMIALDDDRRRPLSRRRDPHSPLVAPSHHDPIAQRGIWTWRRSCASALREPRPSKASRSRSSSRDWAGLPTPGCARSAERWRSPSIARPDATRRQGLDPREGASRSRGGVGSLESAAGSGSGAAPWARACSRRMPKSPIAGCRRFPEVVQ